MPQSRAKILAHVIFSTKERTAWLKSSTVRQELYSYQGTILKSVECPAILGLTINLFRPVGAWDDAGLVYPGPRRAARLGVTIFAGKIGRRMPGAKRSVPQGDQFSLCPQKLSHPTRQARNQGATLTPGKQGSFPRGSLAWVKPSLS